MRSLIAVLAAAVLAAPLGAQDEPQDQVYEEIKNKLDSMRITVQFENSPLREAVDYIRDLAGMNIVIDAAVQDQADTEITIKVKDLLLKSVLKLMLNMVDLTAVYKEGVVLITSPENVQHSAITQVYDVRDLLLSIRDFTGPIVDLQYEGSGGPPLSGATFTLEEAPEPAYSEDFIIDMLQSTTGGDSWDENPEASIEYTNGLLIVAQSRKVHKEILHMLTMLRQFM